MPAANASPPWRLTFRGQSLRDGSPYARTAMLGLPSLKHLEARKLAEFSTYTPPPQHSTARHSTAFDGTARLGTAQHRTAKHSIAQHSTAQYGTVQHNTGIKAQHSTAQHGNTARDGTVRCDKATHSIA